jgi:hypothetical protein
VSTSSPALRSITWSSHVAKCIMRLQYRVPSLNNVKDVSDGNLSYFRYFSLFFFFFIFCYHACTAKLLLFRYVNGHAYTKVCALSRYLWIVCRPACFRIQLYIRGKDVSNVWSVCVCVCGSVVFWKAEREIGIYEVPASVPVMQACVCINHKNDPYFYIGLQAEILFTQLHFS